jgi:hypothetical protein
MSDVWSSVPGLVYVLSAFMTLAVVSRHTRLD